MKIVRIESLLLILGLFPFVTGTKDRSHAHLQTRFLQSNDAIFESFVDIDVYLNIVFSNDTTTVGGTMSDTFKSSYNSLASIYDDPLNRRVENVTVASASSLPQRSRSLQTTSKTRYRFQVVGSCRACPSKTPLLVSHTKIVT
jgi:hypothetical protein